MPSTPRPSGLAVFPSELFHSDPQTFKTAISSLFSIHTFVPSVIFCWKGIVLRMIHLYVPHNYELVGYITPLNLPLILVAYYGTHTSQCHPPNPNTPQASKCCILLAQSGSSIDTQQEKSSCRGGLSVPHFSD